MVRLPLLATLLLSPWLTAQQFAQTARLAFPNDQLYATSASFADFDADGDLDVIATSTGNEHLVRVYRNDGRGRFTRDPGFVPIDTLTEHVLGDFDGDGDIDVLLRGHQLTRRWGGLVAVDRVNIELTRGSVHAVIGTNGAGKS
ncbi:MAG: FG-GAP-like repeat-containing protein, partial [Planctomycetota bacterium]